MGKIELSNIDFMTSTMLLLLSRSENKLFPHSQTESDGVLRVVIATIAFAVGLVSPNIWNVINWKPPNDI